MELELDNQELEATKNREKTADELFSELGYRKSITQLGDIRYYKDDDNVIYFELKYKSFHKSGEYDGMHDGITMEELKAINKKAQELGW